MESLTFYFDRCTGRELPESLKRLGLNVVHQHTPRKSLGLPYSRDNLSLFKPETPDDEWMAFAGSRKWIVVSHDRKWAEERVNREAIKQHQVGVFVLWGAQELNWGKMRVFAMSYDRIVSAVSNKARPFLVTVTRFGRLHEIKIQ